MLVLEAKQRSLSQPRLLFIVPHFNNTNKLDRCLRSLTEFPPDSCNVQTLVIDDGSDNSNLVGAKKICGHYSVLLMVLDENNGVSKARNVGLNYALKNSYDFAFFIDSDDHLTKKIHSQDFINNELTIYSSVETVDSYENHKEYEKYIVKKNENKIKELQKLVEAYSISPNKIPTLTTCWAKIYKLKTINANNIYFNEKMHTFEDVDFLLRYLFYADKVNFIDEYIYAHTNSTLARSATFGYGKKLNIMFSFLIVARTLKILFKKYKCKESFNRSHFLACYYSITFIRIAVGKKNLTSKIELYEFIKRRLSSRLVKTSFSKYDCRAAGGRRMFPFLIKINMPLIFTLLVLRIAKRRYG
jgi:GT2 family glycosyltransferase